MNAGCHGEEQGKANAFSLIGNRCNELHAMAGALAFLEGGQSITRLSLLLFTGVLSPELSGYLHP